jgi:transposase
VIEPETTSCPCYGGGMHVIRAARRHSGTTPRSRHPSPKIRLSGLRHGAVVQALTPERLIRSGLPTEALVAHMLVSKYAWHLPLYRQAQILLVARDRD